MFREISLLIAGIGGQGVRVLARILSLILHSEGYYVTYFSSYGAEVRNTPITASITISRRPISTPYHLTHNIIVVMSKIALNEVTKYCSKDSTILLTYTSKKEAHRISCKKIICIPLNETLTKYNLEKYVNTATLGLLLPLLNIPYERALKILVDNVKDKEANSKALKIGYSIGENLKIRGDLALPNLI